MNKFSERLKYLRKMKGITQVELSKYLGYGYTAISNYENTVHQPDYDTLMKIAEYFGVSVDFLIGFDDSVERTGGVFAVLYDNDAGLYGGACLCSDCMGKGFGDHAGCLWTNRCHFYDCCDRNGCYCTVDDEFFPQRQNRRRIQSVAEAYRYHMGNHQRPWFHYVLYYTILLRRSVDTLMRELICLFYREQ